MNRFFNIILCLVVLILGILLVFSFGVSLGFLDGPTFSDLKSRLGLKKSDQALPVAPTLPLDDPVTDQATESSPKSPVKGTLKELEKEILNQMDLYYGLAATGSLDHSPLPNKLKRVQDECSR